MKIFRFGIILSVILTGLAALPQGSSHFVEAFSIPNHEKITKEALRSIGMSDQQISYVQKGHFDADFIHQFDAEYHFDNPLAHANSIEVYKLGGIHMTQEYNDTVIHAGDCSTQQSALESFGILLHASEDFYAHSNYIERGGKTIVGAKFYYLTDNNVNGILVKSGRYTFPYIDDMKIPVPGCDQTDVTSICSHYDMNKDTPDTVEGKKYYTTAYKMAVKEVKMEWNIMTNGIKRYGPYQGRADMIIQQLKLGC